MKTLSILCCILVLGYILGIRDGFLTLMSQDGTEAIRFPYRAEMLPPADQQQLIRGIPVTDSRQLAQLLEDYLS